MATEAFASSTGGPGDFAGPTQVTLRLASRGVRMLLPLLQAETAEAALA
jgi:hypothetical protein